MKATSIQDKIRKIHKTIKLSAAAASALWAIASTTASHPGSPVRINLEGNDALAKAVTELETAKLIVRSGSANQLIRLIAEQLDGERYALAAKDIIAKFFPNGAPATKVEKPSKPTKRVAKENDQLDWAFRRLRRQATIFFSSGDAELQTKLRQKLNAIQSGYFELKRAFEGDDSELIALCNKHASKDETGKQSGWDNFLAWFFGHTIHPGSRLEAAAKSEE